MVIIHYSSGSCIVSDIWLSNILRKLPDKKIKQTNKDLRLKSPPPSWTFFVGDLNALAAKYVSQSDFTAVQRQFVNQQELATSLAAYVTTKKFGADLNALAAKYVSQSDFTAVQSQFVNQQDLAASLAAYVTTKKFAVDLNALAAKYVSQSDFTAAQRQFVNQQGLATSLAAYVTTKKFGEEARRSIWGGYYLSFSQVKTFSYWYQFRHPVLHLKAFDIRSN